MFRSSPVYRIGGDEFVVLLQDDDYQNRDELFANLKIKMKDVAAAASKPEEAVSIAGGIAVFDHEKDDKVADVFAKADAAMYEDKMMMKGIKRTE